MKRLFEASFLALAVLLLPACGSSEDDSNRVSTSTLSFGLPEGVSEVDDYEPTDGWTKSYSDNPDDPTIIIRVSDDLDRTSDADSTLGVIRGEAMTNGTYGADFSGEEVSKLEVENADIGVEATFNTSAGSEKVHGAWMLLSNDDSDNVSGIEIIGTDVSPSQVDEIRDSLEYNP